MEEIKKAAAETRTQLNNENNAVKPGGPDRSGTLDDEKRVKVLSPGAMVMKRFIRNRLAITGLIILIFMFSFSFVGGVLMPYSQSDVFYKVDSIIKDFAGAAYSKELRYTEKDGEKLSPKAFSNFVLAVSKGDTVFEADGQQYAMEKLGEDFYRISTMKVLSNVSNRKMLYAYDDVGDFKLSKEMRTAFETAHKAGQDSFEFEGEEYLIIKGKKLQIAQPQVVALANKIAVDAYAPEYAGAISTYAFNFGVSTALVGGETTFEADGISYTLEKDGESATVYTQKDGQKTPVAYVSNMMVNAISGGVFLPVEFKLAARKAIEEKKNSFTFTNNQGDEEEFHIVLVNETYNLKRATQTHLIDMYHRPDKEHWLGTDQNGMDVLTRLMYGGRISLLVGFVVVLLEITIGVIVGGISGYFGGWVDNMLMRFVDLFNSIPFWPIMIITGAVMDTMQINPYTRIFLLMLILGIMGWTGIARVVRGQILALREQDFMIATEASGIRVSRRIFKHLVPNVMPLLIVQATMSLGGIILTEATLSFLGLGVKYPVASWGSIINAASNPYVVTNYPNIWMTAGLLILLTVLGFNFVGDGLRDAFDPKMKR